ncbi:TPA: CPBP family intramembrane metalloprotease [Candidatus Micrarchaeota archaeon]|nr:CPBP family intramembrane metalloprotease [Candidatus Micrarchaeota archaeon]
MKTLFAALILFSIVSLAITLIFGIPAIPIIFMHTTLFFIAAYFVWEKNWKTTKQKLGLDGKWKEKIAYGIAGFVVLLVVGMLMSLVAQQFGTTDASKISGKLQDLPLYIIIFSFVFAPISEELFFRGFLTTKFGIMASSIVFAASHLMYGSYFEIIGAFVLGLALAMMYKHSKSILPVIIMHALFNATSIIIMVVQGMLRLV